MSHKSTRRSISRMLTVLVFASLMLAAFGSSGVLTASAQQAGTDTPPVEPTGAPTEETATAPVTEAAASATPVPTEAATETPAATSHIPASPTPTETATSESPLLLAPEPAAAVGAWIHYVKPGASSTNDCHNWATACDLQTALTWPTDWNTNQSGKQVWVAAGIYTPSSSNRYTSFEISNSRNNNYVALYGGFVGSETNLSQRDPKIHPTTLSGDIGNLNDDGDNSYHVVKIDYGLSATIDGFTISGGNANISNGNGSDYNQGGGIYNAGTLTLRDSTLDSNTARYGGGLENAFWFTSTLTNVTFVDNYAYNDGGAMHNCAGSIPVVTNATFAFNEAADYGGAIANGSQVTCGTSSVGGQGNPAGGIGNGSTFRNITVSENSADQGEGVSNINSSPQFLDSIFWGDIGVEFDNTNSGPTIIDSIVYGGCPGSQFGSCTNVINANPLLGSLADNGGYTYTMAIGSGGAATDAGGATAGYACPPPSTDQRGITRPQGTACDIGAYEGVQFEISGHIIGLVSPVVETVDITYTNPTTVVHPNSAGDYSFFVPEGWTGTVTPSLAGYVFDPLSRSYANVLADQTNQDYTATILYTVSGTVSNLSASDVVNVDIDYSIDSGSTVTIHPDSAGYYSVLVPDGSSIFITASLTGYTFAPLSYNPTVTADVPNRNFTATAITYTISGNTDVGNVTLRYYDPGLKTDVSGGAGNYSFEVSYGWTGDVTPVLAGYLFDPAFRHYDNVLANQTNQDYTAIVAYTISGNVSGLDAGTVVNVDIDYEIDGGSTVTIHPDSTGDYSIVVPTGSDVLITPSLAGYLFTPASRNPTNVTSNLINRNFAAIVAYTISGTVDSLVGLDLTTIDVDYVGGASGTVHPDAGGAYTITIPTGWTGTVTPSRTGYAFSPGNRFYNPVTANVTGQDYTPIETPYTISGNAGTGLAVLSYDVGGPQTANADGGGNYSFDVPPGWSGTVTPSKSGFVFNPGSINYTNVFTDWPNQDYIAMAATTPVDFGGTGTSDIVVFRGGAWRFYDFASATYSDSVWTGDPGSCVPAPMDYNGDGATDFTLMCGPVWHFYNDDGSYYKGIWTGITGGSPAPADFNGDGTDDPVVFDHGAWQFYDLATGAYLPGSSLWTGLPGGGGTPAPMDYNGDGTADPTILSTDGAWHFYNDNGSYNKGIWIGAVAGDIPVPGRYSGSAAEQVVIFRGGAWLFYDFATGAYLPGSSVWTGLPAPSGGGEVGPAPLDYNGDGKLDFTYYGGGSWEFYNNDGGNNKGIWTDGVAGDMALSHRQTP